MEKAKSDHGLSQHPLFDFHVQANLEQAKSRDIVGRGNFRLKIERRLELCRTDNEENKGKAQGGQGRAAENGSNESGEIQYHLYMESGVSPTDWPTGRKNTVT